MALHRFSLIAFLVGAGFSGIAAHADTNDVQYAKIPAWVLPPPEPDDAATPPDAPARVIYLDNETRIGPLGEQTFSAYRMKILKPEALTAGNITIAWRPDAGAATVHYLRIIRDNKVTDVLESTKFRILQREGGLEQSVLDGELTATLQTPGLQVGDELEFAASVERREPAFGNHAAGIAQLPVLGMPGAFRYRLLWPEGKPLVWRATPDLAQVKATKKNGDNQIVYDLRDPAGSIPTEGAPPRFNIRRLIEYSDFPEWRDVSRQFWPLFDKAAQLSAASPIRTEATKIAAGSSDPVDRAQAALRLVQDRIRYVYIGLDGGNYKPATAEETWKRRFGDCKAKTVLLVALLRELGIDAEPVLVNSDGGDGTNERLPSPHLFNHVLVRARISGTPYWLDGTRLGDQYLSLLPEPAFRWALPLSAKGAALERVGTKAAAFPQFISVLDIDARTGVDKNATVKAQHIMRGDEAYATRTKLSALSTADADRAIKGYWRQQIAWVEPDLVTWRFDDKRATLIFTLSGQGKPDWTGDDTDGRSLSIIGAGFSPPDPLRRPADQDQSAAWAVEYPRFRCWATTIRLPAPNTMWAWSYQADPMNKRLGGVAYWRASGLKDNVVRTVMSRQSLTPEISAADAALLNEQIPGFNNNMSSVFQSAAATAKANAGSAVLPFSDNTDWVNNPNNCSASTATDSLQSSSKGDLVKASERPKQAEALPAAKDLPAVETIALPAEQAVLNDLSAGLARAGQDSAAMLDAGDKALSKLNAPTKLRGLVQFMRAGALLDLNRSMDALDTIQESIRLLPDYSRPLIAAASIYAYLDRPGDGADYLVRAIDLDPLTVQSVEDYEIGNLMERLNTAHDDRRARLLSDRLLEIGWLGTRLGSRSSLAAQAIKRRVDQGDLAGARALVPKLLIPAHSFSLLMQSEYRPLWPDIETWSGPRLERQWTAYLREARARWAASKSAQASQDYLSALIAAGHYKTAVRDLLPLFDKLDRPQDYDLIFAVSQLAETLARLGRWKDAEALFARAQVAWPLKDSANALNIAANYAGFLMVEGKPGEALKRMDEAIAQARKWGPEVNSSAMGSMYHHRACMLHQLGRDAEAGVSMAMAAAIENPATLASLYVCLGDMKAAKKALIAGLQKEEFRDGIVRLVQLPSDDPLPSEYARKARASFDVLRADRDILAEAAKYGRVVPWPQNAGAPMEAP